MRENSQTPTALPAPTWCFFLLGAFTFCQLLPYLAVVVWVIAGTLGVSMFSDPPALPRGVFSFSLLTFGLLPVYVAWIWGSKRLSRLDKAGWLFLVVVLNMVGMPMFYVFMIRRYLGFETRVGKKDHALLEKVLRKNAINESRLTAAQKRVLLSHCRNRRLRKWAALVKAAIAAFSFFVAANVMKMGLKTHENFLPTRMIIVDSATNEKKEISPDPEVLKFQVKFLILNGFMGGAMVAIGFIHLVEALALPWSDGRLKALIELLKASEERLSEA